MKLLFQFDAGVSAYQIKGELATVGAWSGVKSFQVLERVEGDSPRYCAELDVADDQASALQERVRGMQSQYAGYVTNLKLLVYRAV